MIGNYKWAQPHSQAFSTPLSLSTSSITVNTQSYFLRKSTLLWLILLRDKYYIYRLPARSVVSIKFVFALWQSTEQNYTPVNLYDLKKKKSNSVRLLYFLFVIIVIWRNTEYSCVSYALLNLGKKKTVFIAGCIITIKS